MLATLIAVETLVVGASALPSVAGWSWLVRAAPTRPLRLAAAAFGLAPAYVLFAVCLMPISAAASRILGWSTPPDLEMSIAAMEPALLNWARAMAASHLVRVVAGTLFRGSPLWTWYLRMNGARIGRAVFVNSLSVSDHNLLHIGDRVVIGQDAHVSGHTVEAGFVKTGNVRIGSDVTIGLGAIVEIGVTIEPNTVIGALSFIPKHTTVRGGAVYGGVPVHPLG